jgi:protein arginine kinase activator
MLCQICGKNTASVHFTEIHDNKMTELNLCERCAEEKGLQGPADQHKFSIADVLANMVDGMSNTEEQRVGHVQCPRCGLLYSAFKETGRLGCSQCYEAFQFQLRPLLRRIHGSTRHTGKVPTRNGEGVLRSRQMQRLHDELQRAIELEEFERAAEIRDAIKRIEQELAAGEPPASSRS